MTVIGPEVAFGLIRRLIHGASEAGADLIVTLCPMCQLNLDAYQVEMNKHFDTDTHVPVLYFTQLMGLAFGMEPRKLGIGREIISSRTALGTIGIQVPEGEGEAAAGEEKPRKGSRKDKSLPVPEPRPDEEVLR